MTDCIQLPKVHYSKAVIPFSFRAYEITNLDSIHTLKRYNVLKEWISIECIYAYLGTLVAWLDWMRKDFIFHQVWRRNGWSRCPYLLSSLSYYWYKIGLIGTTMILLFNGFLELSLLVYLDWSSILFADHWCYGKWKKGKEYEMEIRMNGDTWIPLAWQGYQMDIQRLSIYRVYLCRSKNSCRFALLNDERLCI